MKSLQNNLVNKPISKRWSRPDQKTSAEDEWAHLTNLQGERKLEIKDTLDVQDRNITFGGEQKPKTPWEVMRSKTKNAADVAGSTSQYVKFVNSHLEEQRSHIDKLRDLKERFDDEIANLQSTTANFDSFSKIPTPKQTLDGSWQLLDQLIKDKELKKAKINELRNEIVRIEGQLTENEKIIGKMQKQIAEKKSETIQSAKHELESLVNRYGTTQLSEVLENIQKSKIENG